MALTGSTRHSDWARRWGHELPRDWHGGRIQVAGDSFPHEALRIGRFVATVFLIAFTAWALVAIVWSL